MPEAVEQGSGSRVGAFGDLLKIVIWKDDVGIADVDPGGGHAA